MSVPMTFSDLQRWDARNQILRRISLITLIPFDVERRNSAGCVERGVFLGPRGGRAPARPIFWDSLLVMQHPLTQNYQIWCVNTYREELVFRGSVKRPPQGGESQCTPILGVPFVFMQTPFEAELPNVTR